jgi:hypothetical protein
MAACIPCIQWVLYQSAKVTVSQEDSYTREREREREEREREDFCSTKLVVHIERVSGIIYYETRVRDK